MKYKISENVIRRLPRYLRQLDALLNDGVEKISSSELSTRMNLTASQIRQDFNCFGGFGQQGYGYNVFQLRSGIASALGIDEALNAIVIGAGNLGHAIITNFRFSDCGTRLMAAFDISPEIIGKEISGIMVYDVEQVEKFLEENRVDVAVLTLPQSEAENMVRILERHAVKGIWNFTGTEISVDGRGGVIENIHLSDSFLTLGYYVRTMDCKENK